MQREMMYTMYDNAKFTSKDLRACPRSSYTRPAEKVVNNHLYTIFIIQTNLLPRGREVRLRHPHPPLAQRQETGLRAHRLDVGAGEVVLRHDKLLEVDVLAEVHAGGVKAKRAR